MEDRVDDQLLGLLKLVCDDKFADLALVWAGKCLYVVQSEGVWVALVEFKKKFLSRLGDDFGRIP